MQKTDKDRILNFLIGNETIHDFESWVYNAPDLASRVGSELYLELIGINYHDKFVLDNLSKIILGRYISPEDFGRFKYKSVLQDGGWYQNRRIELKLPTAPNSPEMKHAEKIIEEFGGLKFTHPERKENWTLTLVEFLEAPGRIENMSKYGLNKNLVCFAEAHNGHIDLFVDEFNNYYQLDNVVAENLYRYDGPNFEQMMRELLELEKADNFNIIET